MDQGVRLPVMRQRNIGSDNDTRALSSDAAVFGSNTAAAKAVVTTTIRLQFDRATTTSRLTSRPGSCTAAYASVTASSELRHCDLNDLS